MNKDTKVLEMKNIKKDFYGNKVINDISFSLSEGEVLGLVGENGAGKSTLMKILFCDEDIKNTGGYEGEIYISGDLKKFNSSKEAIESGLGMVHQEFSLIPGFNATENILLNREIVDNNFVSEIFGEKLNTLNRKKMTVKAKEAISMLSVNIDENMVVKNMPVGHMQFIEIARELSKDTLKILILDEPTAVLTEHEASILLKSIKELSNKGIAIIFISHRLKEVLEVCDRVVIIRDGNKVCDKKTEETSISEISKLMVGREVKNIENKEERDFSDKKNIMTIKNLYVDMPGEMVKGLNLEVKEGEILGIGGLAGQGKLGIPNGVMGLYQSKGEVYFYDEKIDLNNPMSALSKNISFVTEDRRGVGLLLDETLEWNITFQAMQVKNEYLKKYLNGIIKWRDDKKIKEATNQYINDLQIKCVDSKQKAKELSGGNQQKVCLAKAFIMNPKFLFVSEPTRGIDIGAKALVLEALKKINREKNVTIVMISSELLELKQICDRIAIVSEGKINKILKATEESDKFGLLMLGEDV